MARILVENVTYQLEKLGENDYSLWITLTPNNNDSGISLRGTKKEIQGEVFISLDALFIESDKEKKLIEELSSFFYELNYDCIDDYAIEEAKRTGIPFEKPEKIDTAYYEDFIAKVLKQDMLKSENFLKDLHSKYMAGA